jgi:hypothetical protein
MKKLGANCFDYGRNYERITNILIAKQALNQIISRIKGYKFWVRKQH